jgi:Protein of unknown function (DUF721).
MRDRKTGPTTLSDALASFLRQKGLTRRVEQAGIVEDWAALVGPQIAAVTEPEAVSPDGVLRVRVATGALGHRAESDVAPDSPAAERGPERAREGNPLGGGPAGPPPLTPQYMEASTR